MFVKKQCNSLLWFGVLTILFLAVFSGVYYFDRNSIYLTLLMLTPATSVILAKCITKEKFNTAFLKLNLKGNQGWYLSAYFLTPVIAFAGAALYFLIFPANLDLLQSKYAIELHVSGTTEYIKNLCLMVPLAMVINPLFGILPCLGEELAWRGYLLPKLTERFSVQKAVILDGIVWGLWHSPLIAMGYNYGKDHPLLGVFAMVVFCIVLAVIESALFFKTKSVWGPVVFHASINAMDSYSASNLLMAKEPNPFIGPNLIGIVGGIGFVVVAVILFRKMKDCVQSN